MAAKNRLMVKLLETGHLDDQLTGLAWLSKQPYVRKNRIAVAGNSFGGIEVVLAAERKTDYCAAIDSSGAALTWGRLAGDSRAADNRCTQRHDPDLLLTGEQR